MIIKKNFFPEFTPFSLNIPDWQVEPHINNSEINDLIPLIGDQMYNDLKVIFDNTPQLWNASTNYSVDEFVIEGDKVYKAIAPNNNILPSSNTSFWIVNELGTFFWKFIKPVGVLFAYKELLIFHGINLTQFGIRISDESTSIPADAHIRVILINNASTRLKQYISLMNNKLREKNWTFDNVKYEINLNKYNNNQSNSFKISAL